MPSPGLDVYFLKLSKQNILYHTFAPNSKYHGHCLAKPPILGMLPGQPPTHLKSSDDNVA